MNRLERMAELKRLSGQAPVNSPWDRVQEAKELAPGVWNVSTAGHGGIMIENSALSRFSPELQSVSQYGGRFGKYLCFEEDVEAAAVLLELLEQGVSPSSMGYSDSLTKEALIGSLKNYHKDYIEKHLGKKDIQ